MKKRFWLLFIFPALGSPGVRADLVTVNAITGHDGGNWPTTLGHLTDMVNANGSNTFGSGDHNPGLNISSDPSDPATWINNSGTWQSEWLANSRLDTGTSINNKMGWVVMDFGSTISNLENMYVWNGRYTAANEETRSFNVYTSNGAGIDSLPGMPNSKTIAGDYDFSSGDWSQFGGTVNIGAPGAPYTPDVILSLGGLSARYVGIEILTAEGAANRVGLAQVEFTASSIPEPGSLTLLGLGLLGVVMRQRY